MKILDKFKLNQKLLLLIVVPLIMVAYFASSQTLSALSLESSASRLTSLAALGKDISNLVHELQKERGATAGFLGSQGSKFGPELRDQRSATDDKSQTLRHYVEQIDLMSIDARLQKMVTEAMQQLDQIHQIRAKVDQLTLPLKEALAYYTTMNGKFLAAISQMSRISPDETLSIMTAAYANFLQSKERAGIERAVLSNTFAQDHFAPGMYLRLLALITTQDNYMNVFLSLADEKATEFYRQTMTGESIDETERMRKLALERAESGGFATDPVYWFKTQTQKINLLKKVEDALAEQLTTQSQEVVDQANQQMQIALVLSVLGLLLTALLGWVLARNISRQLGGEPSTIAEIANHIARGELDMRLDPPRPGEESGIYASIVSMRDHLKQQIEHDRQVARETTRIKTALDRANTRVTLVDDSGRIIYVNDAAATMFHSATDAFRVEGRHSDAQQLCNTRLQDLAAGSLVLEELLPLDGEMRKSRLQLGKHTFDLRATPVVDNDGNRLGSALEWDDISELLAEQEREQQRLQEERRIAAENTRIRNALDNVSSCVMMADNERNIVYMNKTVRVLFEEAEKDIRKDLPNFNAAQLMGTNIDTFHARPAHQAGLLADLKQTYESELNVGGRTMRITANPVFDDKGTRLGTAVEWKDRTAEVAVEAEIDGIVAAAGHGDLGQRITTEDKQGFFRQLGVGINQLLATMETTLNDIADVMNSIAQGNLTKPITRDYQGIYGRVKEGVNDTIVKLEEIVGKLRDAADVVSTVSGEITSGNGNLSQRTEQSAAAIEETAASLAQLTSTVNNNADSAAQADQVSTNARQLAEKGGQVVGDAMRAMNEINSSSNQIAEIVGVIDEIAFQTNLLALNASVEAARAGEQGRGFAVVATEVRNLASRSAQSAKEIKELIQDSVDKVQTGSELVNQSGSTLDEIVVAVKKVADIIAEIRAASSEQSAGIGQVNQAVMSLDETTQQNAALAEQTSAAAASLEERAHDLNSLISFFVTRASSGGHVPAPARQNPRPSGPPPTAGKARPVSDPPRAAANTTTNKAQTKSVQAQPAQAKKADVKMPQKLSTASTAAGKTAMTKSAPAAAAKPAPKTRQLPPSDIDDDEWEEF